MDSPAAGDRTGIRGADARSVEHVPAQTVHVRQRIATDCGVACAAMAAGVSYEQAHTAFVQRGVGARRPSRPLSSNFKELEGVLAELGAGARRVRFPGWAKLQLPAILKVRQPGHGRNWHWVWVRNAGGGWMHVHDPSLSEAVLARKGEAPAMGWHACGCALSVYGD